MTNVAEQLTVISPKINSQHPGKYYVEAIVRAWQIMYSGEGESLLMQFVRRDQPTRKAHELRYGLVGLICRKILAAIPLVNGVGYLAWQKRGAKNRVLLTDAVFKQV